MKKTFRLSNPRVWKREIGVFLLGKDKKYEKRLLPFTTEHKVSAKQRTTRGRTIPAIYVTSNENIIDALYRSTGYGKDFYEVGDEKFENKKTPYVVSKEDAEVMALRGLYAAYDLVYDETDSLEVAKKKYEIHVQAAAGTKTIGASTAKEIPHVQVDPLAQMSAVIEDGKTKYEEEYGEPIPEVILVDRPKLLALIDGMNTEGFNVEAFVAEATKTEEEDTSDDVKTPKEDAAPKTKEELHADYKAKFGTNVPNPKSNDLAWIQEKLSE